MRIKRTKKPEPEAEAVAVTGATAFRIKLVLLMVVTVNLWAMILFHRAYFGASSFSLTLEAPNPNATHSTNLDTRTSRSCGNGSDDDNKKELGFLHIPKTGGSAIEIAGKEQAQKNWGYYAWADRGKERDWDKWSKQYGRKYRAIYHHIPPSHFSAMTNLSLAYEGQDLFAVIRNPFKRVVSEVTYWCRMKNTPKSDRTRQCLNKRTVNIRLRETLTKILEADPEDPETLLVKANHFMPQSYFFYNPFTRERQTRYLLHFENLAEDFEDLMGAFSLNITLKTQYPEDSAKAEKMRRTNYTAIDRNLFHSVEDLDMETKQLIVKLYRMDFELGGYPLDVHASDTVSYEQPAWTTMTSKFWELPCQMPPVTNVQTAGAGNSQ